MATVLLIGADHASRRILENAGHAVSMAENFAQSHGHLGHTDVVLTDLHMPVSESLQLIVQLRTEFPQVKILVTVDEHETADFLAVRMIGADDVLRQPLTSKTLLDAVRQALGEGDAS